MANIVKAWAWQCQECQRECVPIRAESRCMCGHRLKEHAEGHKCSNCSCSCPKFSFIVAEGSWILRCRCKHKHTEHDPSSHACIKASCSCSGFTSPWVCNCDHPWSQHQQVLVERQVLRLSDMLAQAQQAGSSSADEVQSSEVASAAAAAAAAEGQRGFSSSLQEVRISSSSTSSSTVLPAGEGSDTAEAVRSLENNGITNVTNNSNSSSRQAGRLSCSTFRLQQLHQQRKQQQQKHASGTVPGSAGSNQGAAAGSAAATAGAAAACAMATDGEDLLLAQGDLLCEVNRWDLLQRGVGRT